MAYSYVEYEGNGETLFPIPFEYISAAYVHATVDGVAVPFTITSPGTLQLNSPLATGTKLLVYRDTEKRNKLVQYRNDAVLDEIALELSSTQTFHIAQEAYDESGRSLTLANQVLGVAETAAQLADATAIRAEEVAAFAEQEAAEFRGVFEADQTDRKNRFDSFILSSGYQDLGDYKAGIKVTARNQVIRSDGEYWKVAASTVLPYTTTGGGMPESGKFVATGDAVLRQALAAPTGASEIGFETGSVGDALITAKRGIPGIRKTLADVLRKQTLGNSITIACYGDSITYGQDTTASGGQPAINGATQTRSLTPYPETLQQAINLFRSCTVINRGFPGDNSARALTRWANASATDVAIIMYGHNDANNYGNLGVVELPEFRQNICALVDREIAKGAAVILMSPPPVKDAAQNLRIRPYAAELKAIAQNYGIPWVDGAEQCGWITPLWNDGVHLSPDAYQELGWHLSALFCTGDGGLRRVAEGVALKVEEGLGTGGSRQDFSGYTLASLAAGVTYAVGVYCDQDVRPIIHSVNTSGVTSTLGIYYRTTPLTRTHDTADGGFQPITGNTLRKGYRTVFIRNDDTQQVYVRELSFEPRHTQESRGRGYIRLPELCGFHLPRRGYSLGDWQWRASQRVRPPRGAYCALVKLKGGFSAEHGLCLMPATTDALTVDSLLVGRAGDDDLLVRTLTGGAVANYSINGFFAVGVDWEGEIEVDIPQPGTITVYVNGVQQVTFSSTLLDGGFRPGVFRRVTVDSPVVLSAHYR